MAKVEFDGFGYSLTASWPVEAGAYEYLRQPGLLEKEAGGGFWSAFYGLGTQAYHRAVGNRVARPRPEDELRMAKRRAESRARKRDRKQAEFDGRVARLIAQLGANDYGEREAASAEILKIGRPALPALHGAAWDRDPEVAERARGLIFKIGRE